ncbi:MAG: hypothetical protein CK544_03935 [Planctomycetaceae bacterium]|nr:MAG: hypothetical protein CK544_03935 [Planctomycetaceae bacterium]
MRRTNLIATVIATAIAAPVLAGVFTETFDSGVMSDQGKQLFQTYNLNGIDPGAFYAREHQGSSRFFSRGWGSLLVSQHQYVPTASDPLTVQFDQQLVDSGDHGGFSVATRSVAHAYSIFDDRSLLLTPRLNQLLVQSNGYWVNAGAPISAGTVPSGWGSGWNGTFPMGVRTRMVDTGSSVTITMSLLSQVFGGGMQLDNSLPSYTWTVQTSYASGSNFIRLGGVTGGYIDNLMIEHSSIVPAPGAVALLGVAGLFGSRRRR